MKSRLLALLVVGAAVIPGTAHAQQLTSPSALLTPGSGGPGVRSTLPIVHLGSTFPAAGNVAPVSGFVPAAFGPAAAADQGFQTAMAIRASSFPPRRYGSLVSMGALTAAYPPFPPAGTVTASNTLAGTSLVPLQSTSYFSNPSSYYGGYATQARDQGTNYPTAPMASGSSQTIVYPWSAYSGPLRRTFQGY
jgi:hypothetical protein